MSEEITRADLLLERRLDGPLPPAEREELRALLRADPGLRRRFAAELAQEHGLRAVAPLAADQGSSAARRAARRRRERAGTRWLRLGLAAAACLLVALATAIWARGTSAGIATVVACDDGCTLRRAGGARAPAAVGVEVRLGDAVEVAAGGACTLGWRGEATRLAIAGGSTLTLAGDPRGTRLDLAGGSVEATVAPQPPGRELAIVTRHARTTVVGTRFTVRDDADATRLEVAEGVVRFGRTAADPGAIEVGADETAVAPAVGPLAVGRWTAIATGDLAAWRPLSGEWRAIDGAVVGASVGQRCRIETAAELADGELTCELRLDDVAYAELQVRGYSALFRLPIDEPGTWHRLRLRARGEAMTAEWDGRLLAAAPDELHPPLRPGGPVGFYASTGGGAGSLAIRGVRLRSREAAARQPLRRSNEPPRSSLAVSGCARMPSADCAGHATVERPGFAPPR